MRYLPLLALPCLLAACGSKGSSSPSATPTRGPVYSTVPKTSPVPVKTVKGQSTSTTKVKSLPTARPVHPVVPTLIPASGYTSTVQGKVTNRKTGRPIANALVIVSGSRKHEMRTNSAGQFSIRFPGGPAAPLEVSKKGYQQYLAMGIVKPKKTQVLAIKLRRTTPGQAPPVPVFFGH
jgi:Carboxypeptidase regulatory-like domain